MVEMSLEEFEQELEDRGYYDQKPEPRRPSRVKRILTGVGRMAVNGARKVIQNQRVAMARHQKVVRRRQGPIKKGIIMDKKLSIWNTPNVIKPQGDVKW